MSSTASADMPSLPASGVFSGAAPGGLAVSVRGLSKSYSIARNSERATTAGEALMQKLRNPFARAERETFWALRDVSFDIQKGDVVGIVGRNGAGKSTLLKILSRITEPTKGQIDLYGRVGSLLEVGTGFHPELTGRENIYLNGAILGMNQREIVSHFDAIVEFAGVSQFLDTPVKRYSSGMYVRLAFAVAAHLNPEILIVDEVLAVGDAEFQKKCLGKMHDVAQSGRTVLFVSHNMGAITELCPKAILMSGGRLAEYGTSEKIIRGYLGDAQLDRLEVEIKPDLASTAEAVVIGCRITNSDGEVLKAVDINDGFRIGIDVMSHKQVCGVEVTAQVGDSLGQPIFSANLSDTLGSLTNMAPGYNSFTVDVPGRFLASGTYTITIGLHQPNVMSLHLVSQLMSFNVEETGSNMWQYGANNIGKILVRFPWSHSTLVA